VLSKKFMISKVWKGSLLIWGQPALCSDDTRVCVCGFWGGGHRLGYVVFLASFLLVSKQRTWECSSVHTTVHELGVCLLHQSTARGANTYPPPRAHKIVSKLHPHSGIRPCCDATAL
jgi:hypothetical protein